MANGLLNSGAKPARGGKRKGAGRKPDWLIEKCKNAIENSKLIEFLTDVADGSETHFVLDKLGIAREIGCDIKDRLRAVEMLMDRGYGKPLQGVEHSGNVATSFKIVFEVEK